MTGGKKMSGMDKKSGVIAKDSTTKMDTVPKEYVEREVKAANLSKEQWKERMFKIHNRTLTLRYADPSGDVVQSKKAYEITESGRAVKKLELEDGITVALEEPVSILETHTGANEAGKDSDLAGSVYLMSPAGKMIIDLKKIRVMDGMGKAKKQEVALGMFQMEINFGADGKMAYDAKISAYLRESLVVKTKNEERMWK